MTPCIRVKGLESKGLPSGLHTCGIKCLIPEQRRDLNEIQHAGQKATLHSFATRDLNRRSVAVPGLQLAATRTTWLDWLGGSVRASETNRLSGTADFVSAGRGASRRPKISALGPANR